MERAAQMRQVTATPPPVRQEKTVPLPEHALAPPAGTVQRITPDSPFVINLDEPYSPIGEEFRKLKSALVKLTRGDEFNNSILVTSAVQHEGKSITALNLAISLAQEYDHTVLLIDADFRRPSIHRYLGIDHKKGFSDYLLGEARIDEVIIPTGIGRLSVITGGSEVHNPVELFASHKTEAMLAEMKNRYPDRYLIFDSAPVLPFAEARSLAHLVDGVLLVVKERLASHKNVREAIEALKGCGLLGLVYNDTLIDRHDEMYSSYQRYNRAGM
jgi:receptor protein-tyrosine kinase/non-specific protein-tyrosine kinase